MKNLKRSKRSRRIVLALLAIFLLPIAARGALHAVDGGARSWRDADWSSTGNLPPARAHPDARVLIMSGQTGGWKGVFSVHSWIVVKPKHAQEWRRYDVVGWGRPVRVNGWAPDGRWFGNRPTIVADIGGSDAEALIPKIEAAVQRYKYNNNGDYRIWPGPNSNTFVASVLRAVPEIKAALPPNAIGRDFRSLPYAGPSDSGTGVEANLWGALGMKLGWVEGVELNMFGLVAGLDVRNPGVKLPGFGRVGFDNFSAVAAPQR